MAHAHLKDIEAETVKASGLLIGTLMGGMLVVSSFIVDHPAVARVLFQLEPVVGPEGQFAGGLRGIDVFVVLIPAAQHTVQATDIFEWRLIEGLAPCQVLDASLEALDALLAGRDA